MHARLERAAFHLLPALICACATPALAQSQTVVIEGAKIIPVVGPTLEQGSVVIQDGRIVQVGQGIKPPYDATVIDAKGKVLFPGMINAHTSRGLDRANESLPVTPFLDVYDAIDPSLLVFEEALRDGVTALNVMQGQDTVVAGLGRVVQPTGLTVEAMTIKAPSAIKIAVAGKSGFDRVKQRAALREVFAELEDYLEGVAEQRYEEEEKKAEREVKVPPAKARELGAKLIRDEDLDDRHKNLYLLVNGRLDAFVYCERAQDVSFAVDLAKKHGFLGRTTFVLSGECYKAAKELKAAGRPVILPPGLTYRETNPLTGREDETFIAKPFADAGVPFAVQTFVSASFAERFLWYQAARCVRNGIDRQTALEAITLVPARILGLEDRLGAITPGRDADILILSGDPLSAQTQVEKVLLGGRVAYERAKDYRLRRLVTGEEGEAKPDGEKAKDTGEDANAGEKPAEGKGDAKPEGESKDPEGGEKKPEGGETPGGGGR